jgi:CTP:molybdopterin cytidylyltransferase MocA
MAAGMGSRYGGLKQVEPFGPGGETLLDYSVFDALRAGFGHVVFVIRREFESMFRERIGRRFEQRIAVDYVFQELTRLPGGHQAPAGREKPWGTAHAVWCAADAVHEPFVAINADDFYGRDAFAQLAHFFARTAGGPVAAGPMQCAMAGYRLADTVSEHGSVSRGVCNVDGSGRLTAIEEVTSITAAPAGAGRARLSDGHERLLPPETVVSMNCWGFPASIFPLFEGTLTAFLVRHGTELKAECYLPTAVTEAINRGTATVDMLPVHATWFGITHRDDRPRVIAALEKLHATGEYPPRLWEM